MNELTKTVAKNVFNKDINKFIPIFSLVYGIILGLVGYFCGAGGFEKPVESVFIGLASGAAATGYHQIGHQLMKDDNNKPSIDNINPDELDTTSEEDPPRDDINIDVE
jgi:ammonia channel protein AmtB